MDKEKLVNKIRIVLDKFMEDISKLNMAMLIKDINSDSYTFLLSSKKFDKLNEYEAIRIVAEYFYKNLSKEEFAIISRINIVSTSDKNLDDIYKAMNVTRSVVYIQKCKFFNVNIDDAILFESNKDF